MTYFAQHGDVEISRLHNAAIRKEISEGLAIGMKPEPSVMLRLLMTLLRRLRDDLSHVCPPNSLESWRLSSLEMTGCRALRISSLSLLERRSNDRCRGARQALNGRTIAVPTFASGNSNRLPVRE
jgi:hypothetical protein